MTKQQLQELNEMIKTNGYAIYSAEGKSKVGARIAYILYRELGSEDMTDTFEQTPGQSWVVSILFDRPLTAYEEQTLLQAFKGRRGITECIESF